MKKNDRPVPFSVPKPSAPGLILKSKAPEATHKEVDTDSKLRNLIKMGKVKEALKYYQVRYSRPLVNHVLRPKMYFEKR